MSVTIKDLEQLQSQNPDWQMELVEGNGKRLAGW